ncbi:hypothetical protein AB6A40_006079 [Gnathostoma spinigerum]|uniref:Ankyrin repeat domain-containing protein 49 n=1 Tax=Gnathostoma spinigerum TaxID=75299 RepID=A0ABD6EHA6_9BILA
MDEVEEEPMDVHTDFSKDDGNIDADGDEANDTLPSLPDAEVLEKIRDEKKRGMFVSGWEEDDEGIAEKNMDDPREQILTAAENGEIRKIEELYRIDPTLLEARDSDHYTPLHRAAYNNHAECVKFLLSLGADPQLKTENGWTVLHCASCWACYDIVAILLSHGVDVNCRSNGNLTPLHLALSSNEDPEKVFHTVRYLLEAPGIDASAVSGAGDTPLMLARRASPRLEQLVRNFLNRL